MPDTASRVTHLLEAWRKGDPAAPGKLMPLVYNELRRIARRYMARENAGHTLQTTALVNEAYLRVVNQHDAVLSDRLHFYAIAAQMMRRLLVDHAPRRDRNKRGGGLDRVSLNEEPAAPGDSGIDVIALHEALRRLETLDPRKTQIV